MKILSLFLVGATAGIWTVNPTTDDWLTLMLQPTSLASRIDGIEMHDYLYFPEANATPIPNVGFTDEQGTQYAPERDAPELPRAVVGGDRR